MSVLKSQAALTSSSERLNKQKRPEVTKDLKSPLQENEPNVNLTSDSDSDTPKTKAGNTDTEDNVAKDAVEEQGGNKQRGLSESSDHEDEFFDAADESKAQNTT